MGTLKGVYTLRKDTYFVYGLFGIILLLFVWMCQYIKDFFQMYDAVQHILTLVQIGVYLLMLSLVIIVIQQYIKAGKYAFYTKGIEDKKTGECFFYNDIISYYFNAQNNNQAGSLILHLESGIKEIPALLPRVVFEIFQQDHAKVWVPFMIKKIDAYETTYAFKLYEDTTSFKMSLYDSKRSEQITLSKKGMQLYETFYAWEDLLRYEVSYTGMVSVVDKANRKVFLEPLTCIEKSYLFMRLLNYYIKED